jgi:hypothetical protein
MLAFLHFLPLVVLPDLNSLFYLPGAFIGGLEDWQNSDISLYRPSTFMRIRNIHVFVYFLTYETCCSLPSDAFANQHAAIVESW